MATKELSSKQDHLQQNNEFLTKGFLLSRIVSGMLPDREKPRSMTTYYGKRAFQYEEIYNQKDPQRQEEQEQIADALRDIFQDRNVLEVACGTGYWTQFLAQTAQRVTATDYADETLTVARATKDFGRHASLLRADAYDLPFPDESFNGGLANFWFSHIPKSKRFAFLEEFHRVLQKGSVVFMADNMNVPGIGGKLITRKGDENTYKLRALRDKSAHLVLKNYPTPDELIKTFQPHIPHFTRKNVFAGKCFWYVSYQTSS